MRNVWKSFGLIILFSAGGMILWLCEILYIKGWNGLNWLQGQLYSPYIVTLFPVLAYITPFVISKQATIKKNILPFTILYFTSIFCFEMGREISYLYTEYWYPAKGLLILYSFIGFLLFPFLGVMYWYVTNKWIKKNKKKNILLITLFSIITIPLSLLSIQLNTGYGNSTGWIDAVKMGYPVFWITLLLGMAGILIAKQKLPE